MLVGIRIAPEAFLKLKRMSPPPLEAEFHP